MFSQAVVMIRQSGSYYTSILLWKSLLLYVYQQLIIETNLASKGQTIILYLYLVLLRIIMKIIIILHDY